MTDSLTAGNGSTFDADRANVRRGGPPAPIRWFLNLFSSIWLGVGLLVFLFIYCAVGSVGVWLPGYIPALLVHDWVHEVRWIINWTQVHIRQAPGLEMTEFEWFHWWPFNLNIFLICLNLIVATLRRIPFNVINLGVWMIHTGIIILAVGSVIYFGLKLEGDAPILRRQVTVQVEGHPPVSFPAQPGAMERINVGDREYVLRIMSIDPHWEILSGDDAGKRAYAVSVAVQSPGHQFVRQLLAGYPQYTEDTIWTGRQDQPMVRAVRELGTPIVDETITLTLDYYRQDYFYLMDSRAIYLREQGQREWVGRPIHGMPRYNERIDSHDAVWLQSPDERVRIDPLEIPVNSVDERDPLAGTPIYVTSFLRYAAMHTRHQRGGEALNPILAVRLRGDGGTVQDYEMTAFDPERNLVEDGRLHFAWAADEHEFEALTNVQEAMLRIRVPEHGVDIEKPARGSADGRFTEIPGTDYSFRVEGIEGPLHFGGDRAVHVAILEVRAPGRSFRRWVFDDEAIAQMDFKSGSEGGMHGAEIKRDEGIDFHYRPRRASPPVTIIAGPREEDLHLLMAITGRQPSLQRLSIRSPLRIQANITLEVLDYAARTRAETRPMIIPPSQRERDAGQFRSIIRVHLPKEGGKSIWLPYHHYAFTEPNDVLRRFAFRPAEITLDDGRVIEIMFSRDRRKLPDPVVLHDFEVVARVGGFTGDVSSIRDWVSRVRFLAEDGMTDPAPISMNKPTNHRGFWFFQAQWDPPDPARDRDDVPSAGLNYTVLGVGNRHGVWTQLFGCIVAVMGMIYAFYVKPVIKRRRQQAVYAQVNGNNGEGG